MSVDYTAEVVYGFMIPTDVLYSEFNKVFPDDYLYDWFDEDDITIYADNEYDDPCNTTFYIGVCMTPDNPENIIPLDKMTTNETLDMLERVREKMRKLGFMNMGNPSLYCFTRVW